MSDAFAALGAPAERDRWTPLFLGGLAGAAILAFAAVASNGLALGLVLSALLLIVGVAALQPAVLLTVLVVALPFHLLAMVLLFNAGVDHTVIRAFSVWKEAVALGLLGVLALRHLTLGRLPRLRALDVAALAFLGINLLYLLFPFTSPVAIPLAGRVQGFRDNTFFVVLYFIGRMAPLTIAQLRLFAAAVIGVGIAGVVVGVVERLAVPIGFFFDPLHFDEFMRSYLNLHYYTGIPYNFWTSVGNVRRAVSFYLGSHHFAMASALLLPFVLVLRRPLRPFPRALRPTLLVLFAIGLALPLTRSVMLACLVQVMVIGWFTRRPHYLLTATLSVMLLLGTSFLFLDLSGYFRNVAAAPASSVATHIASWQDTRNIARNYPLGLGFGVADSFAERSGGGPAGVIGGEGEYAFTLTSIGIPGLLLLVLLLATSAVTVLRARRQARDPAMEQLALITLALLVGYIIVGGFTQVRHVPAFLFPLWWLIGTVTSGKLAGDNEASAGA